MSRPVRVVTAVGLAAAALAIGVAGCSSPGFLGAQSARESVEALLEPTVFHSYAPDIVEFAGHVQAATADTGIMMVDVEQRDDPGAVGGEPIGFITLGLTVSDTREATGPWDEPKEQDPGPYCYRVAFDHWGVDQIRGVDCPEPLVAVPAPPSQRPEVAANAEEAVRSVLAGLPADLPSEEEIAAQVTAQLQPNPNGVTPLAEVTVAIQDGAVAVATGGGGACVLVLRSADGQVEDVYVPSVYLQVGELGCHAGTAFADLRPPH